MTMSVCTVCVVCEGVYLSECLLPMSEVSEWWVVAWVASGSSGSVSVSVSVSVCCECLCVWVSLTICECISPVWISTTTTKSIKPLHYIEVGGRGRRSVCRQSPYVSHVSISSGNLHMCPMYPYVSHVSICVPCVCCNTCNMWVYFPVPPSFLPPKEYLLLSLVYNSCTISVGRSVSLRQSP